MKKDGKEEDKEAEAETDKTEFLHIAHQLQVLFRVALGKKVGVEEDNDEEKEQNERHVEEPLDEYCGEGGAETYILSLSEKICSYELTGPSGKHVCHETHHKWRKEASRLDVFLDRTYEITPPHSSEEKAEEDKNERRDKIYIMGGSQGPSHLVQINVSTGNIERYQNE